MLLVCVCALVALGASASSISGGAAPPGAKKRRTPDPAGSPHIVVDTLNLAHWLRARPSAPGAVSTAERAHIAEGLAAEGPGARDARPLADSQRGGALTLGEVLAAIDATAATLRRRHPGRVVYALKDRETVFNDAAARAAYADAAQRNGVYVVVAERYPDPPAGVPASAEHSARGRDDFLIALLARRYRCAALTEDRLRDFDRFRATIQPFRVFEFAHWRARPQVESIRPEAAAFARLPKPRQVRYADYFA